MKYKIDLKKIIGKYKDWISGIGIAGLVFLGAFFLVGKIDSEEVIRPDGNRKIENQVKGVTDNSGVYDYAEAIDHVGETATVIGKVERVFTSKSGVTFLDFCEDWSECPFVAVIFASDRKKFGDVSQYERKVRITGTIKLYEGKAEIILKNPEQIE